MFLANSIELRISNYSDSWRCGWRLKPLSHLSGVLTPYSVHSVKKNSERRGARCANASNAVQSPKTPYGGVYFEHAQNKRRGLAFP